MTIKIVLISNLLCGARAQCQAMPTHFQEGDSARNDRGGIATGYCLSIAAASRAGLAAFLDRYGPATTVTIPVAYPKSIMITFTITIAVASTFADTDADTVGTDRDVGLGQRHGRVRNDGGAC
jgi:hypothetical protein